MEKGKNINLYLMDGDATGRIKCTIANWTGVVYKIPRSLLDRCKERKELKQSGVYLLFGIDENTGKDVVYVGQAGARKNGEGILNRLYEHHGNPEKDYWQDAVVITTQTDSFGPTEISYLENQFYNLALKVNRCIVKNNVDPTLGNVTEEKECELQEFIEWTKLIIGTMGYRVFTELNSFAQQQEGHGSDETQLLYLKRTIKKYGMTTNATGRQTPEGFVVLKGSTISPGESSSATPYIIKKRHTVSLDEKFVLQEDVLFSSPSGAASFVVGGSSDGWREWKTADDRTLREVETPAGAVTPLSGKK